MKNRIVKLTMSALLLGSTLSPQSQEPPPPVEVEKKVIITGDGQPAEIELKNAEGSILLADNDDHADEGKPKMKLRRVERDVYVARPEDGEGDGREEREIIVRRPNKPGKIQRRIMPPSEDHAGKKFEFRQHEFGKPFEFHHDHQFHFRGPADISRTHHLHSAMHHLRAAGLNEDADRVAKHLDRLEEKGDREDGARVKIHPPKPSKDGFEELRQELRALRKDLEELKKK